MSLPGPLGARLTCGCPLCLLWRRLGEEVHLRHSSSIFQDKAVEVLRVAFDQLVDYREVHGLQLWGDLGRGPSRQRRPLPRLRETKRRRSPQWKNLRRREGQESREAPEAAAEDAPLPKEPELHRIVHGKARRLIHLRNLRWEILHHLQGDLQSRRNWVRRKRIKPTEDLQGVGAPEGRKAVGEGRGRPGVRGVPQARPLWGGERSLPRCEAPPGRWSLSERPSEPSAPPRFRPPEPRGPPPSWTGSRDREGPKSKGVVRRERQADILRYGPGPKRKAERELKRRAWSGALLPGSVCCAGLQLGWGAQLRKKKKRRLNQKIALRHRLKRRFNGSFRRGN